MAPKKASSSSANAKPPLELHSDAWSHFERAVDVVAKSPPQHRIKSALSRYQRQPSGRNLGHDDEASWYRSLGDTLASQEAVNHTAKGYARYIPYPGATNPFTDAHGHHEHRRGIFSIFKRGMKGIN